MRDEMSTLPPAAKGTMSLMGRVGNSGCAALTAHVAHNVAASGMK
jgi:hypothetical protein